MTTVSNRFYVEALADGTTLHGQLLATKPLSQGWTGTTAVPDWTNASNQPTIYVDLLSGATHVNANAGGTWYYNGEALTFDSTTNLSTNASCSGTFMKTTYNSNPAIKIVKNLASSGNRNTDSIGYTGAYTMDDGSAVNFNLSTLVRITGVSAEGIFGQIEFVGSNVITEKNQVLTMVAHLYGADGTEMDTTGYSVTWKLNGSTLPSSKVGRYSSGTFVTPGTTGAYAAQVSESDVTDNCVIECVFSHTADGGTTLTFTAYENIDDQTDIEQMYIQYNDDNNNSATLKKNGSVTFNVWMGTQTSADVDQAWQDFYLKLLDANGDVITGNGQNWPAVIGSGDYAGWRKMAVTTHTSGSTTVFDNAYITITYEQAKGSDLGKGYITGIILAVKATS